MTEVTLHRVRPEEWEEHRVLRLEMLRDAPDAFWTTHEQALELDGATWRERIASTFHVHARLGDDPVGSVGMWDGSDPDPDGTNLIAMYVAPRARRRHVGERLVRAVLEEAQRRGHRQVLLQVTDTNAPARALYERAGFRLTGGQVPHPRRPGLVELEMVAVLDARQCPGRPHPHCETQDRADRAGVRGLPT